MAPQVLKVLIGRVPEMMEPAILHNYRRHPVRNEVFPGIIASESLAGGANAVCTAGLLLRDLSEYELKVLDWFEGDECTRKNVQVQVVEKSFDTQCYVWSNPLSELDLGKEWQYGDFQKAKLDWYLTNTVRPCRLDLDNLGIGRYAQ
jgi:hypothetical protein